MITYIPNNVEDLLRQICRDLMLKDDKIKSLEASIKVLSNKPNVSINTYGDRIKALEDWKATGKKDAGAYVSSDPTAFQEKKIIVSNGLVINM
jgi:hypothetical protein